MAVPPVAGSKRNDPQRPWESMTSLVFPAATGAMGSAGAVTAPIAVRQYIPKDIHTLPPQMQHVAEVDTSVGLLPEPEPPTRTPQKGTAAVRVTPIIVEQRFDGKVTVRMPVPENPGTDWYSDGYVTGKKRSYGPITSSEIVKW